MRYGYEGDMEKTERGGSAMKEMTIKEKVRVAWEQSREVEIRWDGTGFYKGHVLCYDWQGLSFQIDEESQHFTWANVMDIRFVGEEEIGKFGEAISAALETAFEERQQVKVRFLGTTREDEYTGYVKELRAEIPGCGFERVVVFRNDQDIGLTVDLSAIKEITILAKSHDIASERWKWLRFQTPLCEDVLVIPDTEEKTGQRLVIRASATDEQIALMEAAPELADHLRKVLDWLADCGWTAQDSRMIAEATAVLRKAKGDDPSDTDGE